MNDSIISKVKNNSKTSKVSNIRTKKAFRKLKPDLRDNEEAILGKNLFNTISNIIDYDNSSSDEDFLKNESYSEQSCELDYMKYNSISESDPVVKEETIIGRKKNKTPYNKNTNLPKNNSNQFKKKVSNEVENNQNDGK